MLKYATRNFPKTDATDYRVKFGRCKSDEQLSVSG